MLALLAALGKIADNEGGMPDLPGGDDFWDKPEGMSELLENGQGLREHVQSPRRGGAHRVQPSRSTERIRKTVDELWEALITAKSQDISVVLSGKGPSPKDGAGRSAAVATVSVQHRLQGRERGQPIQHPGRPTTNPLHEQGGDRRGTRMGCGRRAQPARRVRHDLGQQGARHLQADDADVAGFDGGFGSYLAVKWVKSAP